MKESITPSPAFARRRPPSSSRTSYGVPSPTPFGLRALTSPPNPKRQALEEVREQHSRLLTGSSSSAFFLSNSRGRPRREVGAAFSSHRLGNILPLHRSPGGEYLAERCGVYPEGVSTAVRGGAARITLLGGGGRAVVSVPDSLFIWEVCAWGDSDAEGSLAPIFHISHPGLDTPTSARNVKLAYCGTVLLAASPTGHIRVWKEPKRFPRRSSDFNLPLEQNGGASNDNTIDHVISSMVALNEDDFFIGSSRGEIWRFCPSGSSARKLQWSDHEEKSAMVGLLSLFMGQRSSNPTPEGEKSRDGSELGGGMNNRVVQMLVLNDGHPNEYLASFLLLVFMKRGGIKAWSVKADAREEVPKWSYSPDSQWNDGLSVLDVQHSPFQGDEVLVFCATSASSSSMEGSEGESRKRAHKVFLNHIKVKIGQQHQGQDANGDPHVLLLNCIPIDELSCSSYVDSTTTSFAVEPRGSSSSSTCFIRAHFWRLSCHGSGGVAVTTVDFPIKDRQHIMNSHDYHKTKVVLPPSILHCCIGGGLRPPVGPGILLFDENGNMVAVSRLEGGGTTQQQHRKQGQLITTTTTFVNVKLDPCIIGGARCIDVDTCNVQSPSSILGREWSELLETAYLAYEMKGDALTPLQPILEEHSSGGCAALAEAVRDASEALLNSDSILLPNAVVDDEAAHAAASSSADIILGNEDGEGRGGSTSTTVLVHQALANKAKRHHSFVGFLHSTMLWTPIRMGQAASVMASHGEQLSAAIALCGAQGRVSQLPHHESLALLLRQAEEVALTARGIQIEELQCAGVSPTLAFFTKVTSIMDVFLHVQDLPESDPLLVGVSEILVAVLDAATSHRLQYELLYELGIRARPWTSEAMVRDVVIRQLKRHVSSRRIGGGTGEEVALSNVWDPKLSDVVLQLANVLLGGFREQKEMVWPRAGREQQLWQDSYDAAKKVAMAAVRMACRPADGWNFALEHECFESLLRLAIQAEDEQLDYPEGLNALRELMKAPPGGPAGGFQDFLLRSLLSEGRKADVLDLGSAATPELLQDILSASGELKLLWMNSVKQERYAEATSTLLKLAKEESSSLVEKHTLLSLAKLSHFSAGSSFSLAEEEKGEDLDMLTEINDVLCITASQKMTLGCDEVDANVKEWEDVVHQSIKQVNMMSDEKGMKEGAFLAANAGLSVVAAQHRIGMRSNAMNNKLRESLIAAAAHIWEVIIKQSLGQPDVKDVLARLASNSIVCDQEVENMWKTGGSLLYLTLSSIGNNMTQDTAAVNSNQVINNDPSRLTDDMIWKSLALAYPSLKRPDLQDVFNLIGKAR